MRIRRRSASQPRTILALLLLGALVATGAALVSSGWPQAAGATPGTAKAPASAAPVTSASPSPATEVTCGLSSASLVYGGSVTVSGTVTPAVAGQQVAIAFDGADKVTAATDAAGAYSASVQPLRSGAVTARAADGTVSAPAQLMVLPAASLRRGAVTPFLRLRWRLHVAPAAYDGVVVVRVAHQGRTLVTVKARCRDGVAVVAVPLHGIGRFDVSFALPAAQGLGARTVTSRVNAAWRTLAAGARGRLVLGLVAALKGVKVRVPGDGDVFTAALGDAVVAFQKAYGLSRSYVMGADDWRKLDDAAPRQPRFARPATHIEVDKRRQILMVVKHGKLAGLIAVSTGATGNTPEGRFTIRDKSPVTTTLFGSGELTWVMGFIGNFAMHGYPEVPPYQASHGCVREPLWVAHWVYDQSFVGERLYVYH